MDLENGIQLNLLLSQFFVRLNFTFDITDQGTLTGSVFIDLKKAFDTVDHDLLIEKLSRHGVRNSELLWFRNFLHDGS